MQRPRNGRSVLRPYVKKHPMLEKLIRHKKTPEERRAFLLGVIAICAIIAVILLRSTLFTTPTPTIPLLPASDTLVQARTISAIQEQTQTPIRPPKEHLQNELFVAGVYPNAVRNIPAGSIALVFVRERHRTLEFFQKPGMTLQQELDHYPNYSTQVVQVNGNDGIFIDLKRAHPACYPAREDGHPGICQLTKILLFENGGDVFSLAIDGSNLTDGELLEMARSVPSTH